MCFPQGNQLLVPIVQFLILLLPVPKHRFSAVRIGGPFHSDFISVINHWQANIGHLKKYSQLHPLEGRTRPVPAAAAFLAGCQKPLGIMAAKQLEHCRVSLIIAECFDMEHLLHEPLRARGLFRKNSSTASRST